MQDLLLQGTGLADQVGILLDGTAAAGLTGITIQNVQFANLDDGIRSQGDIGIGAAADVTIRGNSAGDKSVEDFLDAAIDVGDTDGRRHLCDPGRDRPRRLHRLGRYRHRRRRHALRQHRRRHDPARRDQRHDQ
ncbi:MAG: hypothetical protein R3F55_24640 [Alphaproteobacteria bacterium]